MSSELADRRPSGWSAGAIWSLVLVLDLALAPWTILGSGIFAGRTAGWMVYRSGVQFYRSQHPDETAAWLALFLCVLGAVGLVVWHSLDLWWRAGTPRARSVVTSVLLVVRDHLLLAVAIALLVLAFVFIGGSPETGRAVGG